MEVGDTPLFTAELLRRRKLGLCPYCGQEGHQLQWYLVRPIPGSTRPERWPHDLPSPRVDVSIPFSLFSTNPLRFVLELLSLQL